MSQVFAHQPVLRTLVDQLLEEQATAGTAVDHFARWHQQAVSHPSDARGPSPQDRFRQLIPLHQPGPGEQFAFEVDLSRCTGCKACVTACHSLNGLDATEAWRDVGEIAAAASAVPVSSAIQTVTTACHHCADPACANGCPVLAYEKEESTGIVRHLDDQCIGCSYCILKCPYDVPKYNRRLGIVRKCDMCHQRLSAGEAPACVQACPTEAITIRVVSRGRVPEIGERLVPGAFASEYTRPTTRYVGGNWLSTESAGLSSPSLAPMVPRPEPGHPPLTAMLVLTQAAAGGFLAAAAAMLFLPRGVPQTPLLSAATVAAWAGLAASVLHLGQPLKAWRVFLGWRRSWLSREAMVLGAFGAAALTVTVHSWMSEGTGTLTLLAGVATLSGLAGVAASGMVYVDTRRPFWSAPLVAGKFTGTTLLLGASLAAAVWSWQGAPGALAAGAVALGVQWLLLFWEWSALRAVLQSPSSSWHASALVMSHHHRHSQRFRWAMVFLTGVVVPVFFFMLPGMGPELLTLSLMAMAAGQVAERHQFFTASAAPRMPGLT
jgi:formate dehydrogenase iron-sulfur subunit